MELLLQVAREEASERERDYWKVFRFPSELRNGTIVCIYPIVHSILSAILCLASPNVAARYRRPGVSYDSFGW